MIAFGVIGYVMHSAYAIPVAPLAFGLILGPIRGGEPAALADQFSDGSWTVFLERPIALAMLLLSAAALSYPLLSGLMTRFSGARE